MPDFIPLMQRGAQCH